LRAASSGREKLNEIRNTCQEEDASFGRGLFRCAYIGEHYCGSCSSITTTSSCDVYTPKGYWEDAAKFLESATSVVVASLDAIRQTVLYGKVDPLERSQFYKLFKPSRDGPFILTDQTKIYRTKLPNTDPEWEGEMCQEDPCGITSRKSCKWDSTGNGKCS